MPEPSKKQKASAAIAAACAVCVPLTATFEGLRTKPYRDPAGIATVCYGETERALRAYTPDECAIMLKARQESNYAPAVLKCVPGLAETAHVNAFAASIDASYNAGISAFCRSPMAARFKAGEWEAGCNAFPAWYVTAKGQKLPGLVRRRQAEQRLCLRGAP